MTHVVGIDLGGTEIKFGLFERETGKRIAYAIAATKDGEDRNGRPTWLAAIAAQLENWSPEQNCLVGIAAPGLASRDERSIAIMPGRLEGLAGLDWTRELEWGSQIRVLNDGHAALLGEVWMGSARSAKDVVMLTLGTGVGGAALVDGRLLRGHIGRGGHFGHLSLDPTGPLDIANAPGSLEDAIGNASVSARTSGRFNSTQELADAVERGDHEAKVAWEGSIQALAAGATSLINAFDPEILLLAGGITRAGAPLIDPLHERLDEIEWRPGGHCVTVRIATLADWAGAYGAAYNALAGA